MYIYFHWIYRILMQSILIVFESEADTNAPHVWIPKISSAHLTLETKTISSSRENVHSDPRYQVP